MVDLVDLVLCAKSRIGNWESAHKEALARLGLAHSARRTAYVHFLKLHRKKEGTLIKILNQKES